MFYLLLTLSYVVALGIGAWVIGLLATPAQVSPRPQTRLMIGAWLAVTVALFLTHNSSLFLLCGGLAAWWLSRQVPPLVAYGVLLIAAPVMVFPLNGLGPINNLIDLSYQRVLVWVVLLPALLKVRDHKDPRPMGHFAADWFCMAYGLLMFALQYRYDTLTNCIKQYLYFMTDVFWVYFAYSRLIRSEQDMRQALWALVLGVLSTTLVAGYETRTSWMLYDNVDEYLGLHGSFSYLVRSGTGLMRAYGASGHPLILGLLTTAAALWALSLRHLSTERQERMAHTGVLLCLAGALFASQARGMWVGFAAGLLVSVLTGPKAFSRLSVLAMVGAVGFGVAMMSETGQKVIDTLPFIGTAEQENVTYREQLFHVSLLVIQENPFFGTFNFFEHPLMLTLIQGQGIVDPVNVFIIYALNSGLVGLSLFLGCWLSALRATWQGLQYFKDRTQGLGALGQGHFAVLLAMILMITTTSLVGTIPTMIWICIGVSLAYGQLTLNAQQAERQAIRSATASRPTPQTRATRSENKAAR